MSVIIIDKATIQAVAQLIAERFDPEQIILFGSHARGNAGSHSDIDLLVVLKSLDDWPKRGNPIRGQLPSNSYCLSMCLSVRPIFSPSSAKIHTRLSTRLSNHGKYCMSGRRPEQGWFEKAEADLEMARRALGPGNPLPAMACYHAQPLHLTSTPN